MGVLDLRGDPRLAQEAPDEGVVLRQLLAQQLEGDRVAVRGARPVDDAHGSAPELLLQPVAADDVAGQRLARGCLPASHWSRATR